MKRYLQIEGSDAKGIADVVEALARLFQGKAECRQVLVVKTDSDALAEGLKALFPGKIGEVEVHGEVKRLEAKSPSFNSSPTSPKERAIFREEGKPVKLEARFCRECLKSFVPHRRDQYVCGGECSRRHGPRMAYCNRKGILFSKMYQYKTPDGHWDYQDELGFKMKLSEGRYPEGAKILTPEGWLRIVRMQGGQWTFDEMHPA